MRQLPKPGRLGVLAVTVVLVAVAGCGGSGTSGGTSSGVGTEKSHLSPSVAGHRPSSGRTSTPARPHNRADITFAETMLPLGARTAQMAGLAATHSSSAPIRALGREIQRSREAQAKTVGSWLSEWGARVPAAGGTTPAGAAITGLPSDADLAQLRGASAISFDRLWLRLMVSEQQAELTLARTVLKDGDSAGARSLARDVLVDRRTTIERMRGLLFDQGD